MQAIFLFVATDQLSDEVSRFVMSLFNSSEVAFLKSCFFLRAAKQSKDSILSAIRQVFIYSFKSNTLQNELARSTYLNIVKIELFI